MEIIWKNHGNFNEFSIDAMENLWKFLDFSIEFPQMLWKIYGKTMEISMHFP